MLVKEQCPRSAAAPMLASAAMARSRAWNHSPHRRLAKPLQRSQATWQPRLPIIGLGSDHPAKLAAPRRFADEFSAKHPFTTSALLFRTLQIT